MYTPTKEELEEIGFTCREKHYIWKKDECYNFFELDVGIMRIVYTDISGRCELLDSDDYGPDVNVESKKDIETLIRIFTYKK